MNHGHEPETRAAPVLTLGLLAWPWALAALFGVLTPFLMTWIWRHVPASRGLLELGQGGHPAGWLPWALMDYRLRGAALSFTVMSALIYGGAGLLFCIRGRYFSLDRGVRTAVANGFLSLSMALAFFVIPMLAVVWALALKMEAIPAGAWGVFDGNHGPWRRIPYLRFLLHSILNVPLFGVFAGLLSLAARLSWRGFLVVSVHPLLFLAVIATHYWLID